MACRKNIDRALKKRERAWDADPDNLEVFYRWLTARLRAGELQHLVPVFPHISRALTVDRVADDGDIRQEIVEAFARLLFVNSYSNWCDQNYDVDCPSNGDWLAASPPTSPGAFRHTEKCFEKIEKWIRSYLNLRNIVDFYYFVGSLPRERTPFTPTSFGHSLAGSTSAAGTGLWDVVSRHHLLFVNVPTCEDLPEDQVAFMISRLNLDLESQRIVLGMIDGGQDLKKSPEYDPLSYVRYHRDKEILKMEALNEILKGHGVERIERSDGEGFYYYVYVGDPYTATIIYDPKEDLEFFISSLADHQSYIGEQDSDDDHGNVHLITWDED